MKSTFASGVRTFPFLKSHMLDFYQITLLTFSVYFQKTIPLKIKCYLPSIFIYFFIILGDLRSNKYTFMWKPHNTLNAT